MRSRFYLLEQTMKQWVADVRAFLSDSVDNSVRPQYLTLCAVVKDENVYLPEWIWYHKKIGVEHFYIYDNESNVPVRETLAQQIRDGSVTVVEMEGSGIQTKAYDDCLKKFGANTDWMGFIDVDEFIVPKTTRWLPDLLRHYRRFGGLGIHWLVFGSSGILTRPEGLQIKKFLKHSRTFYSQNKHIKSIVQPRFTIGTRGNPHAFNYIPGRYCVNEKRERIQGAVVPHHSDIVQINHYFTRSREEFMLKIIRGRGDGSGKRTIREFHYTELYTTTQTDSSILKIVGDETM